MIIQRIINEIEFIKKMSPESIIKQEKGSTFIEIKIPKGNNIIIRWNDDMNYIIRYELDGEDRHYILTDFNLSKFELGILWKSLNPEVSKKDYPPNYLDTEHEYDLALEEDCECIGLSYFD
jgi:hypothetical protein